MEGQLRLAPARWPNDVLSGAFPEGLASKCQPEVWALVGLCRLGQEWILGILYEGLRSSEPWCRALAAQAVERWHAHGQGSSQAFEPLLARLIRLLGDPFEEVQVSALGAVLALGGERGVRAVTTAFGSFSETVKAEALYALVSHGYEVLAKELYRVYGSDACPSAYLRRVAERLRLTEGFGGCTGGHDGG